MTTEGKAKKIRYNLSKIAVVDFKHREDITQDFIDANIDKFEYGVYITSIFETKNSECVIKIEFKLYSGETVYSSIVTQTHFTILDLKEYFDETGKLVNNKFEGFINWIAFNSVVQTRGIHVSKLTELNNKLSSVSIPLILENKIKLETKVL